MSRHVSELHYTAPAPSTAVMDCPEETPAEAGRGGSPAPEQELRFVPGDRTEELRLGIAARLLLYLRGLDVRFPACFSIVQECVEEAEKSAPANRPGRDELTESFRIMQDKLDRHGAGPFSSPASRPAGAAPGDTNAAGAMPPPPMPPLNRRSMVSEKLHFFPSGGIAFLPPALAPNRTPAPAPTSIRSRLPPPIPTGPASDAGAA